MTTNQDIPGEIDYPMDRKFGRASDRLAPLNYLHVAGFLAALIVGAILVGYGAGIFSLPLDA